MNSIFADDQSRRSTLDVSLCEERVLGSEKSFYLSSSPKRDESEAYLPSDNEWKNLLSQQDLLDEDCKLLRYEGMKSIQRTAVTQMEKEICSWHEF